MIPKDLIAANERVSWVEAPVAMSAAYGRGRWRDRGHGMNLRSASAVATAEAVVSQALGRPIVSRGK
jgi:hypothetical protein